ncbi:SixA phosphatase family protein [Oricola sp.]|uniref:SixA phosphatase family protein n=1 Tax=Oricola sp. TaxID=1979950 RepID=UPI003BAC8EAB
MKFLYLLRHAKSSWDDPALDDFDRPLAKRGRNAAPLIGQLMAEHGWVPDLALVSPALRTRETWAIVAEQFDVAVEMHLERSLYMTDPDAILTLLRGLEDLPDAVVVVGHNPGMEECAALLAGPGSDPVARARMEEKFPTAALARFELSTGPAALRPGSAALTDFMRPRDIAEPPPS